MTTALDFLSTLPLKDHSQWKGNKNKHGQGNNAHPNVRSKSNNNETNILTNHEIHHCRKIVPVITQVCKETKLWIHPNLKRPNSSFTYSFKFTYLCIDLKKGTLLKKIRNHRQPLNPHQKTKMFRQKSLGDSPKSFNVWGYGAQAKINVFYRFKEYTESQITTINIFGLPFI